MDRGEEKMTLHGVGWVGDEVNKPESQGDWEWANWAKYWRERKRMARIWMWGVIAFGDDGTTDQTRGVLGGEK